MKKLSILLLPLMLIFACSQPITQEEAVSTEESDFVVMAYYVPEKDYQPETLPLDQLTHIIFSFSKVIDGEMKFNNEENGEKLRQLVAQKTNHPHIKVMIACGGWGADGFSDMAHTPENRQKFVNSAIAFIEEYQLDGLDIDWEYPAIPAAGTGARDEDKQNFTSLMKELREGMDQLDRPQTLTFASAGWERYYYNVEMNEVLKYADYMNVMTYDQVGGNSTYTGHHTALGMIEESDLESYPLMDYVKSKREEWAKNGYSWKPRSVERIIDYCVTEGADPKQLVIGAAFYGRAWKGVHPEGNGLYQANGGSYIGWSGYRQIRDTFEMKNGFERHWDEIAQAPYLFNPNDSIFISYDDTMSVRLKTQYAQDKNLGGIMFWQLGNDTKEDNNLLDAIYAAASEEE